MSWLTSRFETLVLALEKKIHIPWILSEGCCSIEIENAQLATYDWQRLGVDDVAVDACESQLLVIAGWINPDRALEIKSVYEKMQKPTRVIAVGACALSGSPYKSAYGSAGQKVIRAEDIVPVDVFVPGCPPRPEALLSAVLELQRKISPPPTTREVLSEALK
jgi:NADH-quinone oxidoreductase subunit B